jgi:hypothetical protein
MWKLIIDEVTHATQDLTGGFARLLPRFVAMLIIVGLGWVVAYTLKILVRGILRIARIDRFLETAGAMQLLRQAELPPTTELLSRFVFWITWLVFLLLGVNTLGIVALQQETAVFFLYLPRVFTALFIVFFGLMAASFFSRGALLAAVNANFPSPRLLSASVRTVIILLTVSMVFEDLGVAEKTILVAFAIVFGALTLGLAIAFGFGGQELAKKFLERRLVTPKTEHKSDEPSPL